jgi:osmotically inducible lipoprotein OsmB
LLLSFTIRSLKLIYQEFIMKIVKLVSIIIIPLISACGSTSSDRALSGAAIGAGAGAVGSSLTGGRAGTGALIGGAAGAAAGGLTKEKDINLGKPIWRR